MVLTDAVENRSVGVVSIAVVARWPRNVARWPRNRSYRPRQVVTPGPSGVCVAQLRGRRLDNSDHSARGLVSGFPIGNGLGNRLIDVIRVEREPHMRSRRHFGQHLG